ncbi:hypothetical protein AX16_006845 [Volvariella volvacea WC 439]|nr:hypothetical protein AX16_006845 [Volvariella volvacea WC 439]
MFFGQTELQSGEDILTAMWFVELPDRILTTRKLIGFQAKALAKHKIYVEKMHLRLDQKKRELTQKYEEDHKVVAKVKKYIILPENLNKILDVSERTVKDLEEEDKKPLRKYVLGDVILNQDLDSKENSEENSEIKKNNVDEEGLTEEEQTKSEEYSLSLQRSSQLYKPITWGSYK